MNSRDAAYDEEEQIRRAIEESKDDNKTSPEENVTRRGKRSRSDSEAYVFPLLAEKLASLPVCLYIKKHLSSKPISLTVISLQKQTSRETSPH
jgi:hypothetical protein